jgi:hypothetical protein
LRCANDFRKTETTPVLHALPSASGLTATSRQRVIRQ